MSIANENNRVDLVATAGQTIFSYNFKINAEDEIAVYLSEYQTTPDDVADLLTLATDYTLTGIGNDSGGNIILNAGATAGDALVAIRSIPFNQLDEYHVGQDHAETLEQSVDSMTMRLQKMAEVIDRCFSVPVTHGSVSVDQPQMGLWTPVVCNNVGAVGSETYTNQYGVYLKIGKMVIITGRIKLGSVAGLITNPRYIKGMPFDMDDTNYTQFPVMMAGYGLNTAEDGLMADFNWTLPDLIRIYKSTSHGNESFLLTSDIAIGTTMDFSCIYFTD